MCDHYFKTFIQYKDPNTRSKTACEQALNLGESREVTREQHAKGDASARGAPRLTRAFPRGSLALQVKLIRILPLTSCLIT